MEKAERILGIIGTIAAIICVVIALRALVIRGVSNFGFTQPTEITVLITSLVVFLLCGALSVIIYLLRRRFQRSE